MLLRFDFLRDKSYFAPFSESRQSQFSDLTAASETAGAVVIFLSVKNVKSGGVLPSDRAPLLPVWKIEDWRRQKRVRGKNDRQRERGKAVLRLSTGQFDMKPFMTQIAG